MENKDSLKAIEQAQFGKCYTRPLPQSYSFGRIPATIRSLMGEKDGAILPEDVLGPLNKQYNKVVLFFIDAFGWRFLERYTKEHPIPTVQQIRDNARVSKLTSQFPFTTSVHVTTVHTGLPLEESSVCEWFYYESRIDKVISPLLFSTPEEEKRGSLFSTGIRSEEILPKCVHYPRLRELGVTPHVVENQDYLNGEYDRVATASSEHHGYKTYQEGLSTLTEIVLHAEAPLYCYYYFDRFDGAMHGHGPESKRADEVIEHFFADFQERFLTPLQQSDEEVLVLMTADHGMTHMDPETTVNLDIAVPAILDDIRTTASGDRILPTGSARDLFLHLKEETIERWQAELQSLMDGKGEVFLINDLIEKGYFGSQTPPERFRKNIGDLVILPYPGESVFWHHDGLFSKKFLGHHGGMTSHEMEIPLIALSVNSPS